MMIRPWRAFWLTLTAVLALTAASTGAFFTTSPIELAIDISADRGEQSMVDDTLPPPASRLFLYSDSVLAGLGWTGAGDTLTNGEWITSLEVCRRLVSTSCPGRRVNGTRIIPPTVLTELDTVSARPGDVLVVATGYNDSQSRFESDFNTIMAAARQAGFSRTVWLTYRDRSMMNSVLRNASDPDLTVWDFETFTAGQTSWFASDGVHLSRTGAYAIADWLSARATDL